MNKIKWLLLVNIILTSAILLSKNLLMSFTIFSLSLSAMIFFYDYKKLKTFAQAIYKLKILFITLLLFQLLLRRGGETYFAFYFLKITDQGVFYAFNSLLRYFIIIISATMLASASPYKIIKALRSWHIPEIITIVVSFTIFFLRQLTVDIKILIQNLKKRNISFKKLSWKKRFELGGILIVPVIGKVFSDILYKVIALEINGA